MAWLSPIARVAIGILLCLAGAATAALSLNLYCVAQMFAGPRAAGTWVGVQNAIGNLSGIVGPIVTGIVVHRAGYNSAFVLTAAIAAVGALWWAVGVPGSSRSSSTSPSEQRSRSQEQRA